LPPSSEQKLVAVLAEEFAEERNSPLQLIEQLRQTKSLVDDQSVKWISGILTIKELEVHR
jgi:hypothetical protein